MKADGIVRRFDDLGRINIPKEIRRRLFGTKCTDGEPMEIFMDGDNVILRHSLFQSSLSWTFSIFYSNTRHICYQ